MGEAGSSPPAGSDLAPLIPVMRQIAWAFVKRTRGAVEADELVSVGYEAAVRASTRWRPDGGMSYQAWCLQRAKGAMLDFVISSARRQGHETPAPEPLDQLVATGGTEGVAVRHLMLAPAVKALSPRQRYVVLRHAAEGATLA